MRSIGITLMVAVALMFAAGQVLAGQEKPSIELGKKLFNEVQPGITGKACVDCHKDGAGLKKAQSIEHHPAMINQCTTNALKGKPLAPNSVEMQSLILYINSLIAKQKPSVGC